MSCSVRGNSSPRTTAGQCSPPLVTLQHVDAKGLRADKGQPRRAGERLERQALQSIDPTWADRRRRAQQHGFVHEVGSKESRGKDWPGLDHQPRDATLGEDAQYGRKV